MSWIWFTVVAGILCFGIEAPGASPFITLGPLDELALDQPRVAVQLVDDETGRTLGPSLANTFLLDTGANSILAVDDAIFELNRSGYQVEGSFFEQGIGGFTEFDVSAEYDIIFAGSDGEVHTIDDGRILSSTETSFCPIPGLCSFFGIIGMPAMENRVTTLDLTTLADDGSGLSIDDIFSGNFTVGFLGTTFDNQLPPTNRRRYEVPIHAVHFPAEGAGPLPSWSDLPFIELVTSHQNTDVTADFVLDTGAQLSLLSSNVAFDLGLDSNNNGTLNDEAIAFQEIGGVGGTINAPVLLFDEVRLPTNEGVELIFSNIQVAIADIDPTIDGILGMNFLSSGWSGSIFGDLGDLGGLLDDAGLLGLLDDLGGLGILGLGGTEAAPFGYFEKVHFDFRNWDTGKGGMVVDLVPDVSGIRAHDDTHGDLNGDDLLTFADREIWVHNVESTSFGDANLDGSFDSRDLVTVFIAGEYEDSIAMNSEWATGDWDMDADFTSEDIVLAFLDGGYNTNIAVSVVPEPTSGLLSVMALMLLGIRHRHDSRA